MMNVFALIGSGSVGKQLVGETDFKKEPILILHLINKLLDLKLMENDRDKKPFGRSKKGSRKAPYEHIKKNL